MSKTHINFWREFTDLNFWIFSKTDKEIAILNFADTIELDLFLSRLESDKIYVMTFELILSIFAYNTDKPTIHLSEPIIAVKDSNPELISKFIHWRVAEAIDSYYLNEDIVNMLSFNDGPKVIIKYSELKIF